MYLLREKILHGEYIAIETTLYTKRVAGFFPCGSFLLNLFNP